jgi:hypothetical protein
LSTKIQTRGRFLAGLTGLAAGASVAGANAAPGTVETVQLGLRYGRGASPRISVSHPKDWFVTSHLTDVVDPIQLFAISNHPLPAPQRNVHGLANPALIPTSGVLLMVSAFRVTPDMAAWSLRSSARPTAPRLEDLGEAERFGNFGLTTRSWVVYGQTWVIQGFLWIGDHASSADVATMDAALQSISYDEAL